MKTISGKLQQKMQSGEISEEEIMREAGDIMGKMKGMKGMGQMNEMFKNLAKGMGGGAGGGSLNVGAMQKMQRQMAAKERMLAKMEEKRAASQKHLERTSDPLRAVFRVDGDEPQEYSVLSAVEPPIPASALNDAELVAMFADKPEKAEKKKSSGSGGNKKKSKK